MRIELLGTGGYHPSERRHTACVWLPDLQVAFDAGTAAFRLTQRLEREQLSIFLSHAHWDHIIGLTYLLVPLARGPLRKVTVWGSRRTLRAVDELLFAEPTFPIRPQFDLVELDGHPSVPLPNGAILTHWKQTSHPGGSTGFRIDWNQEGQNRSLCYVTDTSVDGSYTQAVRGTDLLIHECYFPDAKRQWAAMTGHSTLGDVIELAETAGVKRLVLVHLDPELDSDSELGLADKTTSVPVQIGTDLDSIEL